MFCLLRGGRDICSGAGEMKWTEDKDGDRGKVLVLVLCSGDDRLGWAEIVVVAVRV